MDLTPKNIYLMEQITAEDVMVHHMSEFSHFAIGAMFPHSLDGLTKVLRRILLTLRKEKDDTILKNSQWAGRCQDIHPHGDLSICHTMARMMQPFKYQLPLLNTHGDSGSYRDTGGAQPRYLRSSLSDFVKDVYFDLPKEAYNFQQSESGDNLEIQYLIPKIPMALHLGGTGIGVGFKAEGTPRDLDNVCNLTLWFLDQYSKGKTDFIINNEFPREAAKYLLPHFASGCNILNEEELLNDYEKGNYDSRVKIEGDFTISKNIISISTIPYGASFENKIEAFIDNLKSKNKEYHDILEALDEYRDNLAGTMKVDFKLIFKKKIDIWKFLPRIAKEFDLYASYTPESRYLSKDKVNQLLGPGQLLDIWFRERYRAMTVKFSKEQNLLIRNIHRLEGLLIIKDHVDRVIDIIKASEDAKIYIPALQNEFQLTYFQASEIGKMSIDTLSRANRENLQNLINKDRYRLKQVKHSILNIVEVMKEDVLMVKKKYSEKAPKHTIYPSYLGYIKVGDNYIFLNNQKEISKFKDFDIDEIFFSTSNAFKYRYRDVNSYTMEDDSLSLFPKYISSKLFSYSPTKATNTVILNDNDGKTICYMKGILPTDEVHSYTDDNLLTINKHGIMTIIAVNTLPLRKSSDALGNKTDIIYISNQIFNNSIIFFTNPDEPNTIRAKLIKKKTDKLNMLVNAEATNFHIFPYTDSSIIFTPNKNIFNRVKECHIKVTNPKALFKDKDFLVIDINKLTKKDNIQLIRYE